MLVVAEKPSVARAIRSTIKPSPPVIALRGHILELDFPEYYSSWRRVDPRELFNAPVEWRVRDPEVYRSLVDAIRGADMLILATDNDPEGELIAYEVLLIAEKTLKVIPRYGRIRFNAVTPSELKRAWNNIEPSLKWNWVWKALLRHKFDLITGAAYTRLLTLSGNLSSNNSLVSWGSCVKGDAIISGGEYKPIVEVNVGENCIGLTSSSNRIIRKFARSYDGRIIRVKAYGLLPIELTPEHPVLTAVNPPNEGSPQLVWKISGELTSGGKGAPADYVVIPRIEGVVAEERIPLNEHSHTNCLGYSGSLHIPLNESTSWLMGAYVASGRIHAHSILFNLSSGSLGKINAVIDVFRNLGCKLSIMPRKRTAVVKVDSNELLRRSLILWCGEKPENKRVPIFILQHRDLNLVKAFLEGYVDGKRKGASHDVKKSPVFTTRSKVLALQLQMLCARLGYFLSISSNEHADNSVYIMRLRRNSGRARFKIYGECILVPIEEIESLTYSGTVYNLETADKTYTVSNIVVHNCQMPTLWFVYQREKEIRDFKPEKYYTVTALLNLHGIKIKFSTEPIKDAREAQRYYNLAREAAYAIVTGFQLRDEIIHKPLPTDTDTMLQELSKITGLSAAKIMSLAEALYGDGYISYPRTETNMWLTVDHKAVLSMLSSTPLAKYIQVPSPSPRDGKKNDGAHPPIYPTAYYPNSSDEKYRVWEYIARRYLANVVGKDAILRRWKLNVNLGGVQMGATGKYFIEEGFYTIFPCFKPKDTIWIPELRVGEKILVIKVSLEEHKTKPPPRLTESDLLRLLEEHSIGTDATRADYPQIIIERGYAEKRKKSFYISDLGEALINLLKEVDERLVSPETRRYVERLMAEVEAENIDPDSALREALKIYRDLFEKVSIKLKSREVNSANQ